MRHVSSDFPPGTVIVPTSGTPRYMEFYECLESVSVPAGTRLITTKSAELARSLNQAIDQSIGTWVWFLGDDHTFDSDIVLRLLGHKLPAVQPLTVQRVSPFGPVLLRGPQPQHSVPVEWDDVPSGAGLWALPDDMYTGQAGLLLQREVLAKIEPPYFRVGQLKSDRLNEDFWLNQSIRQLGIPTMVDLGTVMGHINSFAVTPYIDANTDRWKLAFTQNSKPAFTAWPPKKLEVAA